MPTSGVITFSIGRDDIIREALALCGAIDEVEVPSAGMINNAALSLNMMVKSWMAQGRHLWGLQEAVLFLTAGQASYSLYSSGDRASTNVINSELTTDAAPLATTLNLDSSGMTVADQVGILLDDNTMHWTTIDTIPGATSITITTGLASAASSGKPVYAFTSKMARPLRVLSAGVINTNGIDMPLAAVSRQEYFELPERNSQGEPVQYYFDPQLTLGRFYVWPVPTDDTLRVRMTVERPLEDFTNTSDAPDFPIEWGQALCYNLALMLAPKYRTPMDLLALLQAQAAQYLDDVLAFDAETTSLFITPDCY